MSAFFRRPKSTRKPNRPTAQLIRPRLEQLEDRLAPASLFNSPMDFAAGTSPVAVVSGDFNGDGKLDLAVANQSSPIGSNYLRILLGDGAGGFSTATDLQGAPYAGSMAKGDFNHDGNLDLAIAWNYGFTGYVSIFSGDGAGGFSFSSTPFSTYFWAWPSGVNALVVANFNGDGNLDLAVATSIPASGGVGGVFVLRGDGGGGFSEPSLVGGASTNSLAVGDFNGDDKLDLAAVRGGWSGNGVDILLGDGNGSFPTSSFLPVTATSAAIGDFDGDGRVDLVVANVAGNSVSLLRGDGLGGFSSATSYAVGADPYPLGNPLAVEDFNRDGRLDLAVAIAADNDVNILLGDGSTGFSPAVSFAVGVFPRSIVVADFNGDGKPDLAVANYDSNNVSVLLNQQAPPPAPIDLKILSATTDDSHSIRFTYAVEEGPVDSFVVGFYRSADDVFSPDDVFLAMDWVSEAGVGQAEYVSQVDLPIDAAHPYVLVVADPDNQIPELDETNNTASFRKWVIGVVTHGFIPWPLGFPDWVNTMKEALQDEGYDKVYGLDWVKQSRKAAPGQAVAEGHTLATQILNFIAAIKVLPDFDIQHDAIDLHLIGHSRGAVVNSEALQQLQNDPMLNRGFIEMTMLDPHPARNYGSLSQGLRELRNFSGTSEVGLFSFDPINYLAHGLAVGTLVFQEKAKDQPVVIPEIVDEWELYYQRTPWWQTGSSLQFNLWGQTQVDNKSSVIVQPIDLTYLGVSHSGVHEWYLNNVILGT